MDGILDKLNKNQLAALSVLADPSMQEIWKAVLEMKESQACRNCALQAGVNADNARDQLLIITGTIKGHNEVLELAKSALRKLQTEKKESKN